LALQQNRQFEEFASDVARGLASENKALNSRYLYDKVGSQLFGHICLQPEYYLTRTEASILNKHAHDIAKLTGSNISIIELGSGSSSKTTILLSHLALQKKRIFYFPIDISSSILIESAQRLKSQFPNVNILGIPSDYNIGFEMAVKHIAGDNKIPDRKLVVFLGSSIGNFELAQAKSLLRILREKLDTSDFLLVGFDLQKDKSVLNAAYNDKAGITAKFNLNLLARINMELGGNFHLGKFDHYAFYNDGKQRIEMHLVSKTDQHVYVGALGKTFAFRKGETIHTENSYKYSLDQIAVLAEDSGFIVKKNFTDKKKWFDLAFFSPS
jgi:L-histidine N-alpha-methyltransferase